MNPVVKYALGRVGIFVVCAFPALVLLPRELHPLLKIILALIVSAVVSYFLLRGLRAEVEEHMAANARRRSGEIDRLRSALAGEDEPAVDGENRPER